MLGTITITVGQRESEDVKEKDRAKEMAASPTVVEDITKDEQEETPEMIDQVPASESNVEEMAQPAESQANDVGFKKVFKFVGFKFTVKKDKNEKSDTVQLLTVKKDEGEGAEASVGAGDHQEPGAETAGESASKESELKQSTEKQEGALKPAQGSTELPLQTESGQAAEEEEEEVVKDEGEEKPTKSPESPTSPVSNETTSSFKKFFTHGWSGWRKKTSFKKSKEDDLETSEKRKEQEAEKADEEEGEKTEPGPASEQQEPSEGPEQARLSADYEKVELPLEEQVGDLEALSEEKCAPLATEVFDEKMDAHQEVVAEVHVSTVEKTTDKQGGGGEVEGDVVVEGSTESLPPEKLAETQEVPQDAEPAEELMKSKVCVSGGDHTQLRDLSPEEKMLPKHPEGIVSEVEMLSSQERIKVQGSPLKKLFSSSGLKKLSGKKQKGKRGGGGDEEMGESQQIQSESPESADEQKGESSASSPEEPEEITCLEKGPSETPQEGETEEGATSDGEKKREGITPWASFKKMVTPKKRVRRPSESDKEEDLEKVKSATLSSTESTVSEMQDEAKAGSEEQRSEEPKRRVDTSVSWEALICVGSSKKRARKASSSDDEGGPRTLGGDSHRAEEASKDKDVGAEALAASAQDQDQAHGSSSPEPAGSPSEGEGVSTWESFKRLVTPRKKSKSKLEEKTEDSGVEQLASEIEPSKEESWVSIKKFIPGRRKKRADGKQEATTAVEDSGPPESNEDDPDVPAVVPLSEYDAVEREKMEAQRAQENVELPQLKGAEYVSEELSKTLVHTVTVIDGTRAVTSAEERSPSWISASVTEPLEHAEGEAAATPPVEEVTKKEDIIAEETPARTQTLPEGKDDAHDDMVTSEVDFTSEAVTAAETTEALRAEEVTEASGAEETTDMVSAVSQLTDSPDTTEEATPVQEVEGGMLDTEDQERQTQAVLQAVADKVKEESQVPATQTVQRAGPKGLEKVEEVEEDSEATPESLEGPEVTAAALDCVTPCQPVKLAEQATAPESSETLTDSETNGSTPLADSDTPDATQPDETIESQESEAIVATVRQSQVTEEEATPAQEGPSTPPNLPAQEEHGAKAGRDVLELTQQALAAGAVPVLAKTEVGQEAEAGHFDGEKVKDGLGVKELEGSVHTGASSQKTADVTRGGEATEVAGSQENESAGEQSLSPDEREMGTDVEKEKMETETENEEHEQETAHPKPVLTVAVPLSESGKALGSHDGSSSLPDHAKAGCLEVQVQSSDTAVPQTAEAVRKVVGTVAISETDESLDCEGAHLLAAEKSPVPLGPESQAESIPIIVTPAPESTRHPDLQGEIGASQTQRSDEDDKPDAGPDAEGRESTAKEKVLKAEPEILELQDKSSKIVQNVIQTAVDQFARAETAPETRPSDSQAQAPVVQADSQEAQEVLDKGESYHQVSTPGQTPSAAAQEGLAISDGSDGVGKASETINMLAVESARVKESPEKPPLQSKDQKEHAADGPQLHGLAQAEAGASANLTKESPDTSGPKLTEEGDAPKAEVQEEEMNKAQTEEDLQEPKGDLAES
ncbi:A-kinase anchor protein 12 isoform X2 [Apodemus sylvaticus]|uniref:A-kinase anchor protein 12 isoform X2 n=1 Tax=Apodemus sylvaticus TaxID=10129 RepID=UPI00224416AC|nr:A-kinase anchor protein 12 isoform X2 [Apodemus sylvaticus]